MRKIFSFRNVFMISTAVLALLATGNGFAAEKYRVSARFYHLGELIGKPMLEVEAGVTASGAWTPPGWGQYTVVALVRPVADGQVYVSMQFSSGNIRIQPNLLAAIGKPASATVKKVLVELLVEEIVEEETIAPGVPLQLTLNHR